MIPKAQNGNFDKLDPPKLKNYPVKDPVKRRLKYKLQTGRKYYRLQI